eukprot:CAMPEP_0171194104 /NCGR_PEP_ID=MMETSP0790-20130122/20719_1 /TAXON_ID=2925 /ORGANISM="Alexandrium catenella, Strain OF101" /LENGTH=317 /DNA_ID=CAMNT_0011659295 /DNA_START=57 /DNA_END=1010 /DNA_ORIENTATION=+
MSGVGLFLAVLAWRHGLVSALGIQTLEKASQTRRAGVALSAIGSESQEGRSGPIRPRNCTEQLLMVCNAYAYSRPLHIYNMRSQQRLTGKEPLAYKECGDYSVWLREGDQLDFRTTSGKSDEDAKEREAGEHSVGIFRAWGLPKFTSSLLLVPHRQGSSMGIAFESHIFRELQNTQLAVVDAYIGESSGRIRIADARDMTFNGSFTTMNKHRGNMEDLNYNSVIALNAGDYQLVLMDSAGGPVSALNLTVAEKSKQKFVVMRIGADEDLHNKVGNATALPQELFLHQQMLEMSKSSATQRSFLASAFAAALALVLVH